MYRKLQCLQPALVNRKGPIIHNTQSHIEQPTQQKLNELGYKVLPHLAYSPDLSPTDHHFFKYLDNFLQGKCFHSQQDTENAIQGFIELQNKDFYATGINKLISHWQCEINKCVDCKGFYLINKDVFEPSYTDLKFRVLNCNYVCTNLIPYSHTWINPTDTSGVRADGRLWMAGPGSLVTPSVRGSVSSIRTTHSWQFPGGQLVRTSCFHCWGHRFNPLGN